MKSISKTSLIIRIILSVLIVLTGTLFFVFETDIEKSISGDMVSAIEKADFKMHVIDVGQGDSIFLQFSDDKTMLVDCGKTNQTSKLDSFLKGMGISKIDYLVYTHSDEDHIGGGQYVFENYEVDILYRPKRLSQQEAEKYGNPNGYKIHNTKAYDNAILSAYNEDGCLMKYSFEGEEIIGLDYKIKFLNPDKDTYADSNAYSAVLMIEVNGRKILLSADAEKEVESRLIEDYQNYLDADILKVSHHGSKTGSSKEFLDVVTVDYALISVGENQWNMPHEEVLTRLKNAEVKNIFSTNESGTIALGISDEGVIAVYGLNEQFDLDMPIIIGVLIVLLLLVWGIKFTKKET